MFPRALATELAVYGDTEEIMMLVGPRGWTCSAAYGADGSGGVIAYPKGETVPESWGAAWLLSPPSSDEAISGAETGGSPVQAAAEACGYFLDAATATLNDLGHGCPGRPSSESIDEISTDVVGFEDPPGVSGEGTPSGGEDPANGVITYSSSLSPGSYRSTCTLPARQHPLSTASLDEFVAQYENM